MHLHRPQPGREGGFTLLELLVVLAIMAVLIIIVPSASAGIAALRLRAATLTLAETLRHARDDAIRSGRTIEVDFHPERREYGIMGQAVQSLPETVDELRADDGDGVLNAAIDRFRFFADGSASGGRIVLRHGLRSMVVTVEWLTGRVRTSD